MTPDVLLGGAAGVAAAAAIVDLAPLLTRRRRRTTARPGSALRGLVRLGLSLGAPPAPTTLAARVEGSGVRVTVTEVMAVKAGGALAGALAALPLAAAAPGRLGLVLPAAAAAAAFIAPDFWLARRMRARAGAMAAELPDVLDLVRVALDAGLPVRRAIAEVGRRHRGTLAAELRRTADELALGVPRGAALDRLRRRAPHPGTAALAAALERAERHGTPPSAALAALARDARADAGRAVAEHAAKAAPRVQLVVALLLVPSVLLLVAAALVPALA
jgi:tight adherence protein C